MNARLVLSLLLGLTLAAPPAARAEDRPAQPSARGGRTALWTAVGAAAGFGLGLWAGLTVFDDAVNSERKIWTTAIAASAAGGAVGYLIGRRGGSRRPSLAPRAFELPRSGPAFTPPASAGASLAPTAVVPDFASGDAGVQRRARARAIVDEVNERLLAR